MTVSLQIEIPEALYDEIQKHLDRSPEWDQDRTMTAAISLFLMQRGVSPVANRNYLNTMFSEAA